MWLLDITSLLNQGRVNEYTFNPSICWLEKNLFLLSYRVILYDLAFSIHPWGAWFGYKVFKNPSEAASAKYRDWLGPSFEHMLKDERGMYVKTYAQVVKDGENDTTSIALLEFKENKFHLVWHIGQVFPNEYNQDARIMKVENELRVVYNVFSKQGVTLRTRSLSIANNRLLLSSESYLFDHKYRNVEKHCTYGDTFQTIYYSLGETLSVIQSGTMIKTKCSLFDSLYMTYGKENLLISLATPSVSFGNNRLACGHAKIMYKKVDVPFLKHIDTSKVKPHGKYLYFAFFYEFVGGQLLRISPLFIPTIQDCHLPYLLFMTIGLTQYEDKYILSAGEGDTRCKLLFLTKQEIETSLSEKSKDCCFLTESMHIHHVGYYGNKWNCGDDAFQIVFRDWELQTPHTSSYATTFQRKNASSIYVLGGGDVINNYFLQEQVPTNSVAISVGVPYQEFGPLLTKFKRVFLRNKEDTRIYPHTEFLPDITFALKHMWGTVPPKARQVKSVGIILTRTYYNSQYPHLYAAFVQEFALFVHQLITDGFHVVFLPFCINENKPDEYDLLIINDIIQNIPLLNNNQQIEVFHPTNKQDYVRETYFKLGTMSFTICTRFHSHIFSMIHHVPFVSLTCGRKCIELMRTSLPECLFRLKANECDLPIQFDHQLFYHYFQSKYQERHAIETKLQQLTKPWFKQVQSFPYLSLLRHYATNVKTVFWVPPKKTKDGEESGSPSWRLDHPSSIPHFPSSPHVTLTPRQESLSDPQRTKQISDPAPQQRKQFTSSDPPQLQRQQSDPPHQRQQFTSNPIQPPFAPVVPHLPMQSLQPVTQSFPLQLVEPCIASVPSSVVLHMTQPHQTSISQTYSQPQFMYAQQPSFTSSYHPIFTYSQPSLQPQPLQSYSQPIYVPLQSNSQQPIYVSQSNSPFFPSSQSVLQSVVPQSSSFVPPQQVTQQSFIAYQPTVQPIQQTSIPPMVQSFIPQSTMVHPVTSFIPHSQTAVHTHTQSFVPQAIPQQTFIPHSQITVVPQSFVPPQAIPQFAFPVSVPSFSQPLCHPSQQTIQEKQEQTKDVPSSPPH